MIRKIKLSLRTTLSSALALSMMLSLALGILSFKYYRVQTDAIQFYEAEQRGLDSLEILMPEFIRLATATDLRAVDIKHAARALEEAKPWRRLAPLTAVERQNSVRVSNDQIAAALQKYRSEIEQVLSLSNLQLDPRRDAYHTIIAAFSHLNDFLVVNRTYAMMLDSPMAPESLKELGANEVALVVFSRSDEMARADRIASGLSEPEEMEKSFLVFESTARSFLTTYFGTGNGAVLTPRQKAKAFTDLEQLGVLSNRAVADASKYIRAVNESFISKTRKVTYGALFIAVALWVVALALLMMILGSLINWTAFLKRIIREQEAALLKASKLALLGEISAGFGHELNNFFLVMQATTDELDREFGEKQPMIKVCTARLRRMMDRVQSTMRTMRMFARNEPKSETEVVETYVSIQEVFDEVSLLLRHRLRSEGVELKLEDPEHSHVLATESELVQVLANLCSNSIDAVRGLSERKILVKMERENGRMIMKVIDTGPGVPKAHQYGIFEAFFTTKPSGTGLGLSIVKKLVRKWHADIAYEPIEKGCCFRVAFAGDTPHLAMSP